MGPIEHFDHLLIGTGQTAGTLVGGLPEHERVAVVEKHRVGGSCVNYGCTPTKTLVASARVAHVARRAAEYGVDVGHVEIDFARVRERMNGLRHGSREGLTDWLEGLDRVELIRGHARFRADREVVVGDRVLTADHIYLNTGTRARVPPIEGLNTVPWLDNERVLDLETVPEHLVVVGGGYVALEFAQIFRRFGSRVTVLEAADRLLPKEDPEFCAHLGEILRGEGIEIHTQAQVASVSPAGDASGAEGVRVRTDTVEIRGSHLLVAVGRVPNSDDLGLEHTGITLDERGYVPVDDHGRTQVPGVFALGDVNGRGGFTHTAVHDAQVVLDVHRPPADRAPRRISDRIPTYALFTDPPLGRTGLTETQARAAGHRVLTATRPMASISRAKEMGELAGFVKIVVDADSDLLLGVSLLGVGADEIVNMFTAFMVAGRPCREYRKAVFLHPTVSELMPFILDDLQ